MSDIIKGVRHFIFIERTKDKWFETIYILNGLYSEMVL